MNNPYYSSYNTTYGNSVESESKSDLMKVISLKLLKDDKGAFNPIILIVLCCCCCLCILIPFIIIILLIRGGHMDIPDFFPDNFIDFLCEHGILDETTHCSASPTPSPSPGQSVSGDCDAVCLERRDKAERIARASAYYAEQQRLEGLTEGNSSETFNMCLNVLDSECCDPIETIDNSIYDTTLEDAISSGVFWKYVLSTIGAEDINVVPDKYGMLIFIIDGREYCYWHTTDGDGNKVPFNPNSYGSLEGPPQILVDQLPQEYIDFKANDNGHGVKYLNLESQMIAWSQRRERIEQENPKSEDKDWNGDYKENYSEWELVMDTDKMSPLFKKKYWFNWKVFKMVEKYIEDNCAGDIRDGFDSEKSLEIIKIASLDYLSIKQLNVNGLRPEDPTTWNTRNGNPAYNSQIAVTSSDGWTRYRSSASSTYNGWPTEGALQGDKNRQGQRDKMINDWRVVQGQFDLTVSNPYRLDKNGNIARTCGIINPWPPSSGSDEGNSHTDSVKWNDYNTCSGSVNDNNCDGRRKIFKNLWSTWARENNTAVDSDFSRNREADLDAINSCFDSSSELKSCNVHLADSGVYNNPSFTSSNKYVFTETQKNWVEANIDSITYPMSGPMDFVASVKVYDMFLNTSEKNYIKEAITMSQRVKKIVEWYERFFNKPFKSDDPDEQTKLKFNSQKIPSCFDSKVETLKEQWDRYGEIRCFFSKVGCVGSEDSTSCTSVADDEIDSGTMKYCTWCSPDFNCLSR